MRELHEHKVNPANDTLAITVIDNPGAGGANHHYEITGFDVSKNRSYNPYAATPGTIFFQNGPINEGGVNGVTQEVLLAIVAVSAEDRAMLCDNMMQRGAPVAAMCAI